jgi:hypothetical protein
VRKDRFDKLLKWWCRLRGLNSRPSVYKTAAHRASFLVLTAPGFVQVDEVMLKIDLGPFQLHDSAGSGQRSDKQDVQQPDMGRQFDQQPPAFLDSDGPPMGSCSPTSAMENGGTDFSSPFFHDRRTAARPVLIMLLTVWGALPEASKAALKRSCSTKEVAWSTDASPKCSSQ